MNMVDAGELLKALLLPLLFLFTPFILLKLKKYSFSKSLEYLLIRKRDFQPLSAFLSTLGKSFYLFGLMIVLAIIESLILQTMGYNDISKVEYLLKNQPFYIPVIAVLLSPVAEEIFFRGMLQKKFGVIISGIVFGSFHILYGSLAELIGAISLGILLGWYVRKNKSLAPAIFAHMFFNSLSLSTLMAFA